MNTPIFSFFAPVRLCVKRCKRPFFSRLIDFNRFKLLKECRFIIFRINVNEREKFCHNCLVCYSFLRGIRFAQAYGLPILNKIITLINDVLLTLIAAHEEQRYEK